MFVEARRGNILSPHQGSNCEQIKSAWKGKKRKGLIIEKARGFYTPSSALVSGAVTLLPKKKRKNTGENDGKGGKN